MNMALVADMALNLQHSLTHLYKRIPYGGSEGGASAHLEE